MAASSVIVILVLGCCLSARSSLLPITLPPALTTLLPLPTLAPPANPALYNLTSPQMALRDGYPMESHYVYTNDSYILNVFRIPYTSKSPKSTTPKPVVFLQHGLLSSSACWQTNSEGKNLAYIAADNGYDVWLGNARGNMYSRNHTTLNPDTDPEFWDFSYHQSGVSDLPAVIDYILSNTTQKNISYIGHSMGTTMFFVLLSELPAYNTKINQMIALAPVAYTKSMTSPIRLLAPLAALNLTAEMFANLSTSGTGEYQPNSYQQTQFKIYTCLKYLDLALIVQALCSLQTYIYFGIDPGQVNETQSVHFAGHYPQGTSVYTVLHLAQGINSGLFAQFDYGSAAANQQQYGSTTPPVYQTSNIKTPISLIWGANDWLADPSDVATLYGVIKSTVVNFIEVNYPTWNHGDFVTAIDVNKYINTPILGLLKTTYPNFGR